MKKQNIQAEIDFFDNITKHGDHYDTLPEETYEYIFSLIRPYLKGEILEAGCGSGAFGMRIKNLNPQLEITGIDINQKLINIASNSRIYKKDKIICGNLESKSMFRKNEFDTIICPYVVHHFPDIHSIFYNFDYWLKPSGYLIILDPNGSNPIIKFSYLLRKIAMILFKTDLQASPNESPKAITDFKKILQKFHIILIDTSYIQPEQKKASGHNYSFISMLSDIRQILLYNYFRLQFNLYGGNNLIIIAKKL